MQSRLVSNLIAGSFIVPILFIFIWETHSVRGGQAVFHHLCPVHLVIIVFGCCHCHTCPSLSLDVSSSLLLIPERMIKWSCYKKRSIKWNTKILQVFSWKHFLQVLNSTVVDVLQQNMSDRIEKSLSVLKRGNSIVTAAKWKQKRTETRKRVNYAQSYVYLCITESKHIL